MSASLDDILLLLKNFQAGENSAKEQLLQIAKDFSVTVGNSESGLIQNVLIEFSLMFSFYPGQFKGLPLLIELIEFGKTHKQPSEYLTHENWGRLIAFRSNFRVLTLKKCSNCETEYVYASHGGHADLAAFNCTYCHGMYATSHIAIDKSPKCSRGNEQVFDKCPKCLQTKTSLERGISGYEYFYNKRFYKYPETCCLES